MTPHITRVVFEPRSGILWTTRKRYYSVELTIGHKISPDHRIWWQSDYSILVVIPELFRRYFGHAPSFWWGQKKLAMGHAEDRRGNRIDVSQQDQHACPFYGYSAACQCCCHYAEAARQHRCNTGIFAGFRRCGQLYHRLPSRCT